VTQRAAVCRVVVGDALAIKGARGHERQLEAGVVGQQPDQLRPDVPTRPDDADAERSDAHAPTSLAACAASLASRWLRTAGHSASMIEYSTVSRRVPSAWRRWLRITPSRLAPSRSIAASEAWLNRLVLKPTAAQPRTSNAYPSSR